jgi:hypothetical protein
MEQYDWLQNRFFTGRDLHYNQEFFSGELLLWMKKMTWLANMAMLFAGGVFQRSSFLGHLKPSDKKLGLRRIPT